MKRFGLLVSAMSLSACSVGLGGGIAFQPRQGDPDVPVNVRIGYTQGRSSAAYGALTSTFADPPRDTRSFGLRNTALAVGYRFCCGLLYPELGFVVGLGGPSAGSGKRHSTWDGVGHFIGIDAGFPITIYGWPEEPGFAVAMPLLAISIDTRVGVWTPPPGDASHYREPVFEVTLGLSVRFTLTSDMTSAKAGQWAP